MKIPFLDLAAQYAPIREEVNQALQRVMDSNIYIQGPEVAALEATISKAVGTEFAVGVSSGTDALLVSLMGLEIGPGDEVITTDFSFFATAGVIARVGAKPVFVDIDPATFNMAPDLIEAAITKKTKAIIVVHLYGQCAEMERIMAVAETHGLAVIEDAAQAIGSQYRDGRYAGSIGAVGCYSFFPSKNLGAMGDGGMVVTSDPALAERIRIMRVHGAKPKYYHQVIGGNFRLDAIQAAVLNVKFKYLEGWTQGRQANARKYNQLFKEAGLADKGVILPVASYEAADVPGYHIYNQYTIRVPKRDELRTYLKDEGIATEIYYPVPFHRQECFQGLQYPEGTFPDSEEAAGSALSFPIYPELAEDALEKIVDAIRKFYR